MNKKLLAGAMIVTALGATALIPLGVYAAEAQTNDPSSTFVQKLAAKLGIDQSTVQTAVDSTRTEIQTERDTQLKNDIAQAVTDSKLTQRQADILNAEIDVRQSLKPDASSTPPEKEALSSLTEDQRKVKMDEIRAAMEQKLVDALNSKGLNTTLEEVKSTHQAARTAGIRDGFGGGRGHRVFSD